MTCLGKNSKSTIKTLLTGSKETMKKQNRLHLWLTPFMSIIPIQFHTYPFLNQPC